MEDCIFCKIQRGENKAKIVYQDEFVTAFWDIKPIAPVHILIIPNKHIPSLNEITEADGPILAHILNVAKDLAKEFKIDQKGYRLMTNIGQDGRQTVFHMHFHLIGGRRLLGRIVS